MKKTVLTRLAAASAIATLIVPAASFAGTRASQTKIYPSPAVSTKAAPGLSGNSATTPGRAIAEIKANDNAAFKRKSAGT